MTKEMDLIKYKNRVDNHQGLYYMLDSSNIPTACSLLVGLGGMAFFHNPNNVLVYSPFVIFNSLVLFQKYRSFKKSRVSVTGSYLFDKVVKSEEYYECDELYKKYIKSVAEFLKEFNFSSSKELLIFMETLLQTGIFSQDFRHQYHYYKNYYEYVTSLMGAAVLTGASVCRHMSAFFSDILTEYGIPSSFVTVRTSEEKTAKDVLDEWLISYKHAVVGIDNGANKFLFDVVDGSFVSSTGEVDEDLESRIGKAYSYGMGDDTYYVLAMKQLAFSAKQVEVSKRIADLPFATITQEEMEYSESEGGGKFMTNIPLIRDFYLENLKDVERIAVLSQKINPASDEEITEWTLTKGKRRKKK